MAAIHAGLAQAGVNARDKPRPTNPGFMMMGELGRELSGRLAH